MDPPPPKKKKKQNKTKPNKANKQTNKKQRYVVIPGEGWGELGDGAPVRQLSRRHAIKRAIMTLLLLVKSEPVREP